MQVVWWTTRVITSQVSPLIPGKVLGKTVKSYIDSYNISISPPIFSCPDKHNDNRDHSSYRRKSPREERVLTNTERKFMLNAERGDCASVSQTIESHQTGDSQEAFDINCTDPLGRTALSIAIINENPELIEILLESGIKVRRSPHVRR